MCWKDEGWGRARGGRHVVPSGPGCGGSIGAMVLVRAGLLAAVSLGALHGEGEREQLGIGDEKEKGTTRRKQKVNSGNVKQSQAHRPRTLTR